MLLENNGRPTWITESHCYSLLLPIFSQFMFYFTFHLSRSLSVLFRYAPYLTRSALWNFNQKTFVSLSEESSPTHAPPDDLLPHQEQLDPALLSSIPRSENQYNEDFTDYARQVHNSTHGDWPVAEPYEEWTCRRSHNQRYWFYRAWFHHKTSR